MWGLDNKEAPLRLPLQPWSSGLFTNVEFKMMDHTANPHVALAAIVASGTRQHDAISLPTPTTWVIKSFDLTR